MSIFLKGSIFCDEANIAGENAAQEGEHLMTSVQIEWKLKLNESRMNENRFSEMLLATGAST